MAVKISVSSLGSLGRAL